jgi:hypothetical protein
MPDDGFNLMTDLRESTMATAATPKRSFKRTVASTVEGRTPRFLLGSLALAMVISLLAGLGIGVKIGEHSKTTTKTPPVVKPTPTTKHRVGTKSGFAPPPAKGVILRALPKGIFLSRGKTKLILVMAPKTRIELTRNATLSDVKAGSHVLFVLGTSTAAATTTSGVGTTTAAASHPAFVAKQILVVTGAAKGRLGSTVFSVTSDSMSFKTAAGKLITISTVGATVKTTVPATKAKLTPGRHVLVKSVLAPLSKKQQKAQARKKTKRLRVATEIIVLPGDSLLG